MYCSFARIILIYCSGSNYIMEVSTNDLILEQKQFQEQTTVPTVEEILERFVRMRAKLFDMSLLKKFYDTGKADPMDTGGWCLPILFDVMSKQFELNITPDGFRKKLKRLERHNFIKKIPRTNPSVYEPQPDIRYVVRKAIVLWLIKRGYQSI